MSTYASGARSYGGKRKHGLGWVPWVSLLLLALTAAAVYLVLQNVNDENDKAGIDVTDDEVAATSPLADGSPNPGPLAIPAPSSTDAASIRTASGDDVFALASTNRLSRAQGAQAAATNVAVASVVADEGFWVTDGRSQLFVHLTPEAKGAGESSYQVQTAQRVDLQGVVQASDDAVSTFGVSADEGAAQLRQQGAYLEATAIRIR
jgi:hypothetical protein